MKNESHKEFIRHFTETAADPEKWDRHLQERVQAYIDKFMDSIEEGDIPYRIKLQLGWIQQDCYLVVDTCTEHILELEKYSWDEEKDVPEDRNDHTINAGQYGWIPYRNMIGFEIKEEKKR